MRERVWYWLKILKRFLLMFIIGRERKSEREREREREREIV